MAAKKDFNAIKTDSVYKDNVNSKIAQGTSRKGQQGKASPQEAKERANNLRTQGRKGCKAIRINMAFTPDNHEFIKVMATISGRTMTEFTNYVIEQYRKEHPEVFEKAKAIIDTL